MLLLVLSLVNQDVVMDLTCRSDGRHAEFLYIHFLENNQKWDNSIWFGSVM